MHAGRIKILTITLMLLVAASVFYLIFSASDEVRPGPVFTLNDIPDSVFLYQRDDTVRLIKSSAGWKVNGKPADTDRITLLIATLQQSVVRRKVARNQSDSVNRVLDSTGARVEVFAEGRRLLSFQVTGNERSLKTFVRRNDEIPLEVTIPGYRVYAGAVFLLPETEWLDRRIFNFNWRNFKSLTAEFPGSPADDFEVGFNGRFFSVNDLPTDTARLNTYLDEISLLEADGFFAEEKLPDSLTNAVPISRISVHTVSGDSLSLTVYRAGARMLGVSNHLPLSVFSGGKVQLLTRRRNWFKENQR